MIKLKILDPRFYLVVGISTLIPNLIFIKIGLSNRLKDVPATILNFNEISLVTFGVFTLISAFLISIGLFLYLKGNSNNKAVN